MKTFDIKVKSEETLDRVMQEITRVYSPRSVYQQNRIELYNVFTKESVALVMDLRTGFIRKK